MEIFFLIIKQFVQLGHLAKVNRMLGNAIPKIIKSEKSSMFVTVMIEPKSEKLEKGLYK